LCTVLSSWLAEREGIGKERLQDLAVWLFVGGIIGARLTFAVPYILRGEMSWVDVFRIWDGGLVFYGAAWGGMAGYLLAYKTVIHKYHLSTWKIADAIAPSIAVGLCLGRIGCFLNGCCFGAVACPDCVQVQFPFSSPPRSELTRKGYQTPAGFTLGADGHESLVVGRVDPDSAAAKSGLQAGDVLLRANDRDLKSAGDLEDYFGRDWP